jgi:hypothetical protein
MKYSIIFPNDEAKWAWVAGVVDADGYVRFTKSTNKSVPSRGFRWLVAMQVSSVYREFLNLFKEIVGYGSVSKSWINQKRGKEQPYCKFSMSSDGLRKVLPRIIPYLTIKKKRAELVLEALSMLKRGRQPNHKETDEKLEKIYQQVKVLNRRGLPLE